MKLPTSLLNSKIQTIMTCDPKYDDQVLRAEIIEYTSLVPCQPRLSHHKKRILASTSSVIFSVICCTRQLLLTIFIKLRQKYFIIWFQIRSNSFGKGHKLHCRWILLESILFSSPALLTSPFFFPRKKTFRSLILVDFC